MRYMIYVRYVVCIGYMRYMMYVRYVREVDMLKGMRISQWLRVFT